MAGNSFLYLIQGVLKHHKKILKPLWEKNARLNNFIFCLSTNYRAINNYSVSNTGCPKSIDRYWIDDRNGVV